MLLKNEKNLHEAVHTAMLKYPRADMCLYEEGLLILGCDRRGNVLERVSRSYEDPSDAPLLEYTHHTAFSNALLDAVTECLDALLAVCVEGTHVTVQRRVGRYFFPVFSFDVDYQTHKITNFTSADRSTTTLKDAIAKIERS